MHSPKYVFRQLFDHSSFTFTYILGSAKARQAIIIDPVVERVSLYTRLFKELDLRLVKCVDTHIHADHISANGLLREQTGCAIVMPKQSPVTDVVGLRIEDGDEIEVSEDLTLRAIHTPGHTSDSYSFYVGPHVIPGSEAGALFTGDTLFIRGTGRTDFQHGNPSHLFHSLSRLLAQYPPDTTVFPAHDYKGEAWSTLAEEKAHNPRLLIALNEGEAAFVDHMRNLKLAHPKLMDVAVPANLALGLPVSSLQQAARDRGLAYTPQEAKRALSLCDSSAASSLVLVDLRDECERRHHGSVEASLGTSLTAKSCHVPYSSLLLPQGMEHIGQLSKAYQEVILYCAYGERSALALNKSHEAGYTNVKHLQGGLCSWLEEVAK